MPLGLQNIEWLNQNSQRSYPFAEDASRTDTTGTITIPNSFLLEAQLPIHAGLDVQADQFFLYSLRIDPAGFGLVFAYNDGTSTPPLVATVSLSSSLHQEDAMYAVAGINDFVDTVGQIVIGILDDIEQLPPGQYYFDFAGGQLEVDAIRPMIRGISSLSILNGTEQSPLLYGDIQLVAGDNFRLTLSQTEGQPPQIVFSAISGEGLNADCDCGDGSTGTCIQTINGVGPDSDGNFRMAGNDCLDVQAITNGVQTSDTCSKPCCGCAELDAINAQLTLFANSVVTQQNYVANLGARVAQFEAVVLGSRLNDQECLS